MGRVLAPRPNPPVNRPASHHPRIVWLVALVILGCGPAAAASANPRRAGRSETARRPAGVCRQNAAHRCRATQPTTTRHTPRHAPPSRRAGAPRAVAAPAAGTPTPSGHPRGAITWAGFVLPAVPKPGSTIPLDETRLGANTVRYDLSVAWFYGCSDTAPTCPGSSTWTAANVETAGTSNTPGLVFDNTYYTTSGLKQAMDADVAAGRNVLVTIMQPQHWEPGIAAWSGGQPMDVTPLPHAHAEIMMNTILQLLRAGDLQDATWVEIGNEPNYAGSWVTAPDYAEWFGGDLQVWGSASSTSSYALLRAANKTVVGGSVETGQHGPGNVWPYVTSLMAQPAFAVDAFSIHPYPVAITGVTTGCQTPGWLDANPGWVGSMSIYTLRTDLNRLHAVAYAGVLGAFRPATGRIFITEFAYASDGIPTASNSCATTGAGAAVDVTAGWQGQAAQLVNTVRYLTSYAPQVDMLLWYELSDQNCPAATPTTNPWPNTGIVTAAVACSAIAAYNYPTDPVPAYTPKPAFDAWRSALP
jgi:hypothetical protein